MSSLTTYKSVTISDMMSRIEQYKHNPSAIQQSIFNILDEVSGGEIDIVDPTNPFVFLLEASCVNTSLAVNENVINLRKLYPSLAQTSKDLYHHMADSDYLNRFASPATAKFTFTVPLSELQNLLVYDPNIDAYRGTIKRNSSIKVDGMFFSLQYPIEILKFTNGQLRIKYDSDVKSPLQNLTSNIIDYGIKTDDSNNQWLYFTVPIKQMRAFSSQYPVQRSLTFKQSITFIDKFYYCRVWCDYGTGSWTELSTTHSDLVYDKSIPTALLEVIDDSVSVTIPNIYVESGLVSGVVRIDVYTTKGKITVNLSNYKLNSFFLELYSLDEANDATSYSAIISRMSMFAYSSDVLDDGTDGLTLEELRSRIINNSVGPNNLPITNIQLENFINDQGFSLVKDVDAVTNRIFLATKGLPAPSNSKLITSASMGMMTVITDSGKLSSSLYVSTNLTTQTIHSNSFFKLTNGVLELIDNALIGSISNMNKADLVEIFNGTDYLYNPYYNVLDYTDSEFNIRVYDLDKPLADNLSFVSQNQTLSLIVNTSKVKLTKETYGYKLIVEVKSDSFYKDLPDTAVGLQLAFTPIGESTYSYIEGNVVGLNAAGERVYEFALETNHDIDQNNNLTITNSQMFTTNYLEVKCPLDLNIELFHVTTSVTAEYVADDADALVGKFQLTAGTVGVTRERLHLQLGLTLSKLWKKARTLPGGIRNKTYDSDIPLLYDTTIYDTDPVTGSIFTTDVDGNIVYNIAHQVGDVVTDVDGTQLFKHRAGDFILDSENNPIVDVYLSNSREFDILLVDGKYLIADDLTYKNYISEITDNVNRWILDDLPVFQDNLLEQTEIYFYPKNKLGYISVYPDSSKVVSMPAEQSFQLNLFVSSDVFYDAELKDVLYRNTITTISDYVKANTTINMTDLTEILNNTYGPTVISFTIDGLGGVSNYSLVKTVDSRDNISINKKVILQQDNTIILKEDIDVIFQEVNLIV